MLARIVGGPMLGVILGMLTKQGGLTELLDKFRGAGLGHKADSWVGTGPNQALNPDELERALGPEEIQQIADKTGMAADEVRAKLAEGLPEVISHVTPDGVVPDDTKLGGLLDKLERFIPG
jgi:uncharacterized protein YidB (DUF937 family)